MSKYPTVLTSDDVRKIIRGSPNASKSTARAPANSTAQAQAPNVQPNESNVPSVPKVANSSASLLKLQLFLKGYHRITVPEACQRIANNNVDVFIKLWTQWQQVDAKEVKAAVDRAGVNRISLCNAFLKGRLQISDKRYNDIKARFDDAHLADPTGVYAANDSDRVAVVISM